MSTIPSAMSIRWNNALEPRQEVRLCLLQAYFRTHFRVHQMPMMMKKDPGRMWPLKLPMSTRQEHIEDGEILFPEFSQNIVYSRSSHDYGYTTGSEEMIKWYYCQQQIHYNIKTSKKKNSQALNTYLVQSTVPSVLHEMFHLIFTTYP